MIKITQIAEIGCNRLQIAEVAGGFVGWSCAMKYGIYDAKRPGDELLFSNSMPKILDVPVDFLLQMSKVGCLGLPHNTTKSVSWFL